MIGEPLVVLFRRVPLLAAMLLADHNPFMWDFNNYQRVAPRGEAVTRHESVGAFRVSTSSWSTRLAKLQLEQTRQWQCGYTAKSPQKRSQQARATYAVLRAKGAF